MQTMIMAISPDGVNLQVLGYFEGTVEQIHMSASAKRLKVGKKIKARILYCLPGSPTNFVLAFSDHIMKLTQKTTEGKILATHYPIGATLKCVTVTNVEPERGIVVNVALDLQGFVHVDTFSNLIKSISLLLDRSHMSAMIMSRHCHRILDLGKLDRNIPLA